MSFFGKYIALSVKNCMFSIIHFACISLYVIIAIGFLEYSFMLAIVSNIPTLLKPDIPIGLCFSSMFFISSTNFLDLPSSPNIVFIFVFFLPKTENSVENAVPFFNLFLFLFYYVVIAFFFIV